MSVPEVLARGSRNEPIAWIKENSRVPGHANGIISIDVSIILVNAWFGDSRDESPPDFSDLDGDLFELFANISFKWDACCHVNFAEDGYAHLCGRRSWETHIAIMSAAWDWGSKTFADSIIHDSEWNEKLRGNP